MSLGFQGKPFTWLTHLLVPAGLFSKHAGDCSADYQAQLSGLCLLRHWPGGRIPPRALHYPLTSMMWWAEHRNTIDGKSASPQWWWETQQQMTTMGAQHHTSQACQMLEPRSWRQGYLTLPETWDGCPCTCVPQKDLIFPFLHPLPQLLSHKEKDSVCLIYL